MSEMCSKCTTLGRKLGARKSVKISLGRGDRVCNLSRCFRAWDFNP